jgi:hypothetical protein
VGMCMRSRAVPFGTPHLPIVPSVSPSCLSRRVPPPSAAAPGGEPPAAAVRARGAPPSLPLPQPAAGGGGRKGLPGRLLTTGAVNGAPCSRIAPETSVNSTAVHLVARVALHKDTLTTTFNQPTWTQPFFF